MVIRLSETRNPSPNRIAPPSLAPFPAGTHRVSVRRAEVCPDSQGKRGAEPTSRHRLIHPNFNFKLNLLAWRPWIAYASRSTFLAAYAAGGHTLVMTDIESPPATISFPLLFPKPTHLRKCTFGPFLPPERALDTALVLPCVRYVGCGSLPGLAHPDHTVWRSSFTRAHARFWYLGSVSLPFAGVPSFR